MREMLIRIDCPSCQNVSEVRVEGDAYDQWVIGKDNIQDLMPELTSIEREVLITGICESCQSRILGEE
jgi:hypothetical protein